MIRTEDRRSVVLLCPLVHDCHVASTERIPFKTINGRRYPTVDTAHLLWVKQFFDPEYYDESYLESIWVKKLPEPEIPPSFWLEQMLNNQGIELC